MGTLITQVKLPKQISLVDWDVTEDGVDINGTYNYISFPSPITSFPLEGTESGVTYNLYASEDGSEYSLIYSGGTPIVEGYKHSSLESYMFYDGSQWALWFDGTYQWVNPNGSQNILPFNNWQIYIAQGAAGNIQVLDSSTGKNISFLDYERIPYTQFLNFFRNEEEWHTLIENTESPLMRLLRIDNLFMIKHIIPG